MGLQVDENVIIVVKESLAHALLGVCLFVGISLHFQVITISQWLFLAFCVLLCFILYFLVFVCMLVCFH